MKRKLGLFLSMVLAFLAVVTQSQEVSAARSADDYSDFIRGVDISMLLQLEEEGGKFYDNGVQSDALTIMNNHGANYVRLRLWVDPYDSNGEHYGGGHNDYATTLAMAKRAKQLGMGVLIDFHLSDYWADPGTQSKPKAWTDLSYADLKSTLTSYVENTMNQFVSDGVTPDMVQIGNEISSGILWDDGKVGDDDSQFEQLGDLLSAGISGVRNSNASDVEIILHLDNGGSNDLYTWWFGTLLEYYPNLDFDIIGLTYYPMWHGTMDELQVNLNDISAKYDKDVAIVETAYAYTLEDGDGLGSSFSSTDEETAGYDASAQGQIEFMTDLESIILNVPNNRGLGYFYWEPEWIPVEGVYWGTEAGAAYIEDTGTLSNPWDNLTLFDFDGNALDSIDVLNVPEENLIENAGFEEDASVVYIPSGWNTWLQSGTADTTVKTEWSSDFGSYKLTFWDDSDYECSAYQTFSGLENGTYMLTAWVMGNGGQDVCQMYIKNYGGDEINAAITSSNEWSKIEIKDINITNGQCELGFYAVANAGDWCNIDHVMFRKQ